MKLQFYVDNFRTLLFPILIDLNNAIFMKSIFDQNNVHIIIQLIFHYQLLQLCKIFFILSFNGEENDRYDTF